MAREGSANDWNHNGTMFVWRSLLILVLAAAVGPALAGYDLHITRALDWTGSESRPVPRSEWARLVEADPELSFTREVVARSGAGETISLSGDFAIWRPATGDREYYLEYRKGRITAPYVDEQVLEKMRELSKKLHARLVGDEGEEY